MPTYEQLYAVNNGTDLGNSIWLLKDTSYPHDLYGIGGSSTYWLATAYSNSNQWAFYVDGFNLNTSDHISFTYGLRPTITISKDQIDY